MLWGYLGANGIGKPCEHCWQVKCEHYLKISEVNLHKSSQKLRMGCKWMLQWDNGLKQTDKLVHKWLTKSRVNVLPWLLQSPDLVVLKAYGVISKKQFTAKIQQIQLSWTNIVLKNALKFQLEDSRDLQKVDIKDCKLQSMHKREI